MIQELINHPDFWKYCSIPVVAALVGWSTNWLAIKLMFYPLEFVGFKPLLLGWQGVIPSKARKMAQVVVEKGLENLANISEVYQQIDRKRLSEELVKVIDMRLETYIDELMNAENATLWENLPLNVREGIYKSVRKQLPQTIDNMLADIGDQIDSLFDLEDMVVNKLINNKELLNQIFQDAGEQEFKFIINSGLYFGFLFGVIQMGVWYFYPEWWILPLFGLIVGYATNEIALKIIFQPVNPIHIGPFTLQGLFLKRQKAVAHVLCHITTTEVITISNILYAMLTGPKRERTHKMIQKHVRKSIDDTNSWGMGIGKPVVKSMLGTKGYIDLKMRAAEHAILLAEDELLSNNAFNVGQKEIIEDLLRTRMESLSSEEFQGVLRPAFQEDEWKLIAVGALLGLGAGFAQLFFVFGSSI
ncbi:MAG: hypothetical protein R3208_06665 [Ketobacteraceae bacterium]|nr:hypothetical protein [Ketobacteraceae bacterium]